MSDPEISRVVRVDHVGEGLDYTVEASAAELVAVAKRMGVVAVASLWCAFDLRRAVRGVVPASGTLRAHVTQTCVVSLEDFDTDISEQFDVRFVPAGTESEEVDLEAVDEVPYAGGVIDLGEAASEQLALALDPFPRKPGAALPEDENPDDSGPFSALRGKVQ